jgi:hypothetical protein
MRSMAPCFSRRLSNMLRAWLIVSIPRMMNHVIPLLLTRTNIETLPCDILAISGWDGTQHAERERACLDRRLAFIKSSSKFLFSLVWLMS